MTKAFYKSPMFLLNQFIKYTYLEVHHVFIEFVHDQEKWRIKLENARILHEKLTRQAELMGVR